MEVRPTRLCLVRHGETAWNVEHRLQGHLDVPLNPTGEAQALATAAGLATVHFAAVYCSDLQRARQTAVAITRDREGRVEFQPRLRERHYGVFQGLTYTEAEAHFPDDFRRFKQRDPHFTFPGGGESLTEFAGRVEHVLADLAATHHGEQVLIVTHGGVLDIVHRLAAGKALDAPRDFAIPNAALNWIEYDGTRWHLVSWADKRHLAAARDELPNA
ncbi:histidine phosphatase family protein [Aromatoleum toluclasticum]|uniref:histidine phosphatase family protein n=1 Tax=Aromatoleum toluclasticum TaxID=92003 RepID=UPI00036DC107|nr:histidine phosphatase family protein [Aromatoleum toluclasticum]MCC4116495.1 histidine phosphatase family protein [Aromatoleum toluclasticum]